MKSDNVKINLQYFLPKYLITIVVGYLASLKMGKITTLAIRQFARFYKINTAEMQGKIEDYKTFNDFFARPLKKNARKISTEESTLVFPADGKISQFGNLQHNFMLQAKGHYFTTEALLANDKDAKIFADGSFITVYLSPSDYHRVHIPFGGKLLKMTYIPGELFSVNPLYTANIPELFSRNERVVCIFETKLGKMAIVLVGAAIVRSVSTVWEGVVAPNKSAKITTYDYAKKNILFDKGNEIGKFLMGSTVICLFEKDKITFDKTIKCENHVDMGQEMAKINNIHTKIAKKSNKTKE